MSLAQQTFETVIAAGQFNDGTSKNIFGNAVATFLEIMAVVSLGIGGWQVFLAQAKKGAQNEKFREIGMIMAITALVAGFFFFIPQWAGIGEGVFSGFMR